MPLLRLGVTRCAEWEIGLGAFKVLKSGKNGNEKSMA